MKRSLTASHTVIVSLLMSLALLAPAAHAQSAVSEASALSLLPVGVSVAATGLVLSAGMTLVIVSVESTARGTVWVLERASDGARFSVRFTGQVVGGVSMAVGTTVAVLAIGSGYVLSAAGQALAFIPNEIGAALLYNEQVTR